MALANVLLSVSVELKRLGAKSQQKTMRGRGTDGLQRCSGSDHEPYAQTDHNKRNSTTKQSESRTNRPRAGKLRLAKRQPETIVIGRLNEKEELVPWKEKPEAEGEERELASSCDDFTSERARTIGKIVWPDDPGCLSQFYLLCSAGSTALTCAYSASFVEPSLIGEWRSQAKTRGAAHRGQERRRPSSWLAVFTGRLVQGIDIPCLII